METELDIENYNFDELLDIFQIPRNFNENHLKHAKRCTLQTHPDKSGLPSEYFLFYSKAYKKLYSVWEFRKERNVNNKTEYESLLSEEQREAEKLLLDSHLEEKDSQEFNTWFNAEFMKQKQNSQEAGYGEWIASTATEEERLDNTTQESLQTRKRESRELVTYNEIEGISSSSMGFAFASENSYQSSLYSALPFTDFKQAHTETIIPVSEEMDFVNRQHFSSVNELTSHRQSQNLSPLSVAESNAILQKQNDYEVGKAIESAFFLNEQTELAMKKNKEFWSQLKMIR